MNESLKNFSMLGIAIGVVLLYIGGVTLVHHGVPREPLPLAGQ